MRTRALPRRPARERGISLVVVLVLVLALGLMSALGIRASSTTASVATSVRAQALAMEAAEAALRYCETQAISKTPAVTLWEPPLEGDPAPVRWKEIKSWQGSEKASATVPAAWIAATGTAQAYTLAPECMVERLRLPSLQGTMRRETFLITARGFAPESTLRPDGRLRSGSEVWLQSTLEQ